MHKLVVILLTVFFVFTIADASSLKDVVQQSVKKHPNISYLRYVTASIDGDIGIAGSSYFPRVYAKGSAGLEGHDYNDGAKNDGTTTEAFVGFDYDIFDGKKRKYNNETERFRKLSSQERESETINSFTLEIVSAYLEVLKQRELVKVSEEVFVRHKKFYNKVKTKFDRGLGRLAELKKAESLFTTSKLNNSIHMIDLDQAVVNLSYYLGSEVDSDTLERPELFFQIPESMDDAFSDALASHPSLDVAKKNIQVAKSEMQRDMNAYYPNLTLKGSYGYRDDYTYTDYRNEYSMMLELNYDIFDGNEKKSLKLKRHSNLLQKYELLEKARQDIKLRLGLAWHLYENIKSKINFQIETYQIEKVTLETYHKEFLLGISDLMDISVAENEYIRSIKDLVVSQYDLLYTKFRVYEAMGLIYSTVREKTGAGSGRFKDDIVDWNNIYESLLESPEISPVLVPTIAVQPDKTNLKCYKVNATSLNIRAKADIDSAVAGNYANGTNICGKEISENWLKTSKGWVSLEYLILVD